MRRTRGVWQVHDRELVVVDHHVTGRMIWTRGVSLLGHRNVLLRHVPNPSRRELTSTRMDAVSITPRYKLPRRNYWVVTRSSGHVPSVLIRVMMTWQTMYRYRPKVHVNRQRHSDHRGVHGHGRVPSPSSQIPHARAGGRLIGTVRCHSMRRGTAMPIQVYDWRRRRRWAGGRCCMTYAPTVQTIAAQHGPADPVAAAGRVCHAVDRRRRRVPDDTLTIREVIPRVTNLAGQVAVVRRRSA